MSEEKYIGQESAACKEEFVGSYSDRVHVIGRVTLSIAAVLSFLPILYLNFVKGYTAPLADYILVFTTICAVRVGMWISEPFTWYPILGALYTSLTLLEIPKIFVFQLLRTFKMNMALKL